MTVWEISVFYMVWSGGDYNGTWENRHDLYYFSSRKKAQAFKDVFVPPNWWDQKTFNICGPFRNKELVQ